MHQTEQRSNGGKRNEGKERLASREAEMRVRGDRQGESQREAHEAAWTPAPF